MFEHLIDFIFYDDSDITMSVALVEFCLISVYVGHKIFKMRGVAVASLIVALCFPMGQNVEGIVYSPLIRFLYFPFSKDALYGWSSYAVISTAIFLLSWATIVIGPKCFNLVYSYRQKLPTRIIK